jgi:hypothetical protein
LGASWSAGRSTFSTVSSHRSESSGCKKRRLFWVRFFWGGGWPLVPLLLLLGPPFFKLFFSCHLPLPGMTGSSLYMQWTLTSQSHGRSVLKTEFRVARWYIFIPKSHFGAYWLIIL